MKESLERAGVTIKYGMG